MTVPIGTWLQTTVSFYPETSGVAQNVFHWKVSGSAPPAEGLVLTALSTALTAFYAEFEAFWADTMVSPLVTVDVIDWNAIEGAWRIQYHLGDFNLTTIAGTLVDDPLPAGVSLLVSFVPIYRNHTGKKYIAGFTEYDNDTQGTPGTGLIAAAALAAAQLIAHDWTIESGLSTLAYTILDRTLGEFNYMPIAGIIRNNWSYQRRRKEGVGA